MIIASRPDEGIVQHLTTLLSCLLWGLLLAAPARAEPPGSPGHTLDAFHQAAAAADREAYLTLTTPDVVFLGTDGEERWQGDAFREYVSERFASGGGWTYQARERHVTLSADGRVAWFDEVLDNETLGQCRGSGVLQRTGEGWRVALYNLSVPIPNRLVDSVVAAIRADPGGPAAAPPAATLHDEESPDDTAPTASVGDEESATESASTDKRCPVRHKTNRRASC